METSETSSPNNYRAQVAKRVLDYKNRRSEVSAYMKTAPGFSLIQLEADQEAVSVEADNLGDVLERIQPFVQRAVKYAPDILEGSKFSACAFLIGKISRTWQSVILLAKQGFHYEIMELLRSNREAMDLVHHFLLDDGSDLTKWFKGEEIMNRQARPTIHKFVNSSDEKLPGSDVFIKIKSSLYSMMSKYSHVTYAALLDQYSVFEDGFDFNGFAGFHYTKTASLPYAHGEMYAFIDCLRFFFLQIDDQDAFENLKAILTDISPETFDRERFEELMKELVKKYSAPDAVSKGDS